ncbi:MAG: PEP-CTERM sorting domain-containing protein [Verrucomicrobiota bacterium]
MQPKLMTNQTRLPSRLSRVSLGAATLAASATGLTLTEKAEASIAVTSDEFIFNTDPITVSYGNYLNIFLPTSDGETMIMVASFGGSTNLGWNMREGEGDLIIYGSIGSTVQYLVWISSFYTNPQTFNLANYDDSDFGTQASFSLEGSVPGMYIGLRRAGAPTLNGWTYITFGTINHQQTVFNNSSPSNITIGQVPEPSAAALLLAAGSIGLAATRRRRNTTP